MELKKELVSYVIFGAFTTLINIAVYLLLTDIFHINYIIANIVAWFVSVMFAYVTNRIWVFESDNENVAKEVFLFYGGRIFTVVVDTLLMVLFIDVLSIGNFVSKITVSIIVIILNYLFSKWIVFD
jgi:putative flippase GtrA